LWVVRPAAKTNLTLRHAKRVSRTISAKRFGLGRRKKLGRWRWRLALRTGDRAGLVTGGDDDNTADQTFGARFAMEKIVDFAARSTTSAMTLPSDEL